MAVFTLFAEAVALNMFSVKCSIDSVLFSRVLLVTFVGVFMVMSVMKSVVVDFMMGRMDSVLVNFMMRLVYSGLNIVNIREMVLRMLYCMHCFMVYLGMVFDWFDVVWRLMVMRVWLVVLVVGVKRRLEVSMSVLVMFFFVEGN